jgi:hypothetical protein
MLFMKLVHSLVAKDINRLRYVIIFSYFLVKSYFYFYYFYNIVLTNYHVDFKIVLHIMHFILILYKHDLKLLINM